MVEILIHMKEMMINRIVSYFEKHMNLNEDQREDMAYSIEAIGFEILKSLIIFLIFILLGKGHIFLPVFIFLIMIRMINGGFHLSSQMRCFLFSLTYLLLIFYFSDFLSNLGIHLSKYNNLIFTATVIVDIFIAPVSNSLRPKRSKSYEKRRRIIAFFNILGWYLITFKFQVFVLDIFCLVMNLHLLEIFIIKFLFFKEDEGYEKDDVFSR